ncbi:MAG: hypothetical protein KGM99_18010, partial [Burkholderiales bacterium]|nr:hypothetical protein [Burkholderiales bacterium]
TLKICVFFGAAPRRHAPKSNNFAALCKRTHCKVTCLMQAIGIGLDIKKRLPFRTFTVVQTFFLV